jgi:pyruvyltransferase
MGGLLNLYWHRSINFGDMLSPYLLAKFKGVNINEINFVEPNDECEKYIITGSIISDPLIKNAIIFGAGFVNHSDEFTGINCTIKGVRGNKTFEKLGSPEGVVIGEPSLCLPYFFNPKPVKKYKSGITPHICDLKEIKYIDHYIDLRMGEDETITETIERVIYQINECEMIYSSSLHGLIVAAAYGIPYRYYYSPSLVGDGFKFTDFMDTKVDVEKLMEAGCQI